MKPRHLLLLLLAALLLTACASRMVRNQPPLAQITSWTLAEDALLVDLHLRNINEEPMPLTAVSLNLTVGDTLLARHRQPLDTSVATSGFESIPLRLAPTPEGRRELEALEDGARKSLTYRLDGSVTTSGGRELVFERDGHVYTVPGRPGQFR